MSAVTATLAGRRAAERNMVDACLIRHRTGESTDPDTGVVTPTYSTVYAGKCRVQQRALVSQGAETGQAHVFQVPYELQLPMSVTGVAVEDVVTVTASVLDPELVGRLFWIRGLGGASHKTARRLPIEEVTG